MYVLCVCYLPFVISVSGAAQLNEEEKRWQNSAKHFAKDEPLVCQLCERATSSISQQNIILFLASKSVFSPLFMRPPKI